MNAVEMLRGPDHIASRSTPSAGVVIETTPRLADGAVPAA
jgi:hypothetical protein